MRIWEKVWTWTKKSIGYAADGWLGAGFALALGCFFVVAMSCKGGKDGLEAAMKRVEAKLDALSSRLQEVRQQQAIMADSIGVFRQEVYNFSGRKIKIYAR